MALIKCPDCGREISDLATTCIGCGRPLSPQTKVSQKSGNWEYNEFGAKIDCGEFSTSGFPINGSIPYTDAIRPITLVVQSLVNMVGKMGWEPAEPIEVDRLYRASRITGKGRSGGFLDSNSYWKPLEVRINFRRWSGNQPENGELSVSVSDLKNLNLYDQVMENKWKEQLKEIDELTASLRVLKEGKDTAAGLRKEIDEILAEFQVLKEGKGIAVVKQKKYVELLGKCKVVMQKYSQK